MDNLTTIGIVGLGTMGRSIAKLCLGKGFKVISTARTPESSKRELDILLNDLKKKVAKGKLTQEEFDKMAGNIRLSKDLSDYSEAGFVIEAIYEDEKAKEELYGSLEPVLGKNIILATNTSSLSIEDLSIHLEYPSRFLGLHFFNPAEIMKLVEVRRSTKTNDESTEKAKAIVESLGKNPIMTPDLPGIYVNRILFPMLLESISVLESTDCPLKDIDDAMKLGANLPMGPLELCDFIGNDIVLNISNVLLDHTGDLRFKPPKLLHDMVREGRLGRKSGRGFYEYK